MGTSKIIMLSGIYLILGFYTVGFGVADESNFALATQVATQVQAEQIARTGISLALANMANVNTKNTFSNSAIVLNGNATYTAIGNTSQSVITSIGLFNKKSVTVKAVVVYSNNRWRISRIYIPPTA